ncbi:MAG: hypothetical protein ACT4PK_01250 [Gammaproteobacteria bacterium]
MDSIVLWMFAAALAGATLALALAWLAWQLWGRPRYDAELLRIQDVFEQRVRAGVLAAGRELLPALREQVKLGFQDALKDSHAAGIAEGTAKIVSGSTDLVTDALSNLFGLKKK